MYLEQKIKVSLAIYASAIDPSDQALFPYKILQSAKPPFYWVHPSILNGSSKKCLVRKMDCQVHHDIKKGRWKDFLKLA